VDPYLFIGDVNFSLLPASCGSSFRLAKTVRGIDGERRSVRELERLFINSGYLRLREISAVLANGDWEAVARGAHKLPENRE
jgi:hypothetical protein